MSQTEVKSRAPLVPLGTLLGRELRNDGVEKPAITYGQAGMAKRGEDRSFRPSQEGIITLL